MDNRITTKQLIQQELEKRGISQKEIAKILGVSPPYVNDIIHDKKSGNARIFEFAEKLGVDLFDKMVTPNRRNKPIPVISWVHAGMFAESSDIWPTGVSGEAEPVYSYVHTSPNAFALRIEGDSMMPRFMPGDIAIVDPLVHCDNGCACVVWLNGEVSLKIFKETEDEIRLCPLNDRYEQRVIRKDSKVDFRVIGKVVDIKVKL